MSASLSAAAQGETPKVEVFGGYSFAGSGTNGFNAAVEGRLNKWFGVVADFGGQFTNTETIESRENIKSYSYVFGPQFSIAGNRRVKPFGCVLFGGSHLRTRAVESGQMFEFSDNSFTVVAGGGLDVRVNKTIAVRALQADYVRTKFFGATQNKGRLSFGIVFRFGGK